MIDQQSKHKQDRYTEYGSVQTGFKNIFFFVCFLLLLINKLYLQLLIRMKLAKDSGPMFLKVNPKFKHREVALGLLFNGDTTQRVFPEQVQPICFICQKLLRKQAKIATDSNIYCVGCFATILPSCQYYRVLSHESFDIMGGGWPARDQIILLSAIERFGFGNWGEIQEYMAYLGANYFMNQIETHYDRFYGKLEDKIEDIPVVSDLKKVANPSRKNCKRVSHGGKVIEKSTCFEMPRSIEQKDQQIPCYNSKRGEFNIEYKENLQKYIADLEFRDNDSQKEIQLKYQILQAYNLGLEDRIQKHNFILEHRLLDQNYQAEESKYLQSNLYANRAHELLIELMRTMSKDDYLQLRKSLQFCLRIQTIIDRLRSIRSSNPTSSLRVISKLDKSLGESTQDMGKPRKRVHRNPQNTEQQQEEAILKKLNVSKEELRAMIVDAQQRNEAVFYKDIKITPINNLAK